MRLIDMITNVWTDSGLAELWALVAPWLALDERQMIFVVATPLAVAEAECNTVTGLKQVHHAATPLPLS